MSTKPYSPEAFTKEFTCARVRPFKKCPIGMHRWYSGATVKICRDKARAAGWTLTKYGDMCPICMLRPDD